VSLPGSAGAAARPIAGADPIATHASGAPILGDLYGFDDLATLLTNEYRANDRKSTPNRPRPR